MLFMTQLQGYFVPTLCLAFAEKSGKLGIKNWKES